MLSRILPGGALAAVAGAAMLLSTSGPSAAFTLSSPSLEQPVAAAGVERVQWDRWEYWRTDDEDEDGGATWDTGVRTTPGGGIAPIPTGTTRTTGPSGIVGSAGGAIVTAGTGDGVPMPVFRRAMALDGDGPTWLAGAHRGSRRARFSRSGKAPGMTAEALAAAAPLADRIVGSAPSSGASRRLLPNGRRGTLGPAGTISLRARS